MTAALVMYTVVLIQQTEKTAHSEHLLPQQAVAQVVDKLRMVLQEAQEEVVVLITQQQRREVLVLLARGMLERGTTENLGRPIPLALVAEQAKLEQLHLATVLRAREETAQQTPYQVAR